MHRSRMVTLLGGALLAAFLLPSVALASAPAATTVTPTAPNITLHCARVIPAGHPARDRFVCRWTAVTGVAVRAYRLYRFVDAPLGRPRQLVARVTPDKPLRAVDWRISDGHRYSYKVVADRHRRVPRRPQQRRRTARRPPGPGARDELRVPRRRRHAGRLVPLERRHQPAAAS